ncbi:MAG: hypothetical protein UX02_C0002G0371 [Candidatus Moranbacteria bacterium GW2011_GWC1_45_18]|nr:MAG: hypothetical protein UT79_C0001G0090 [Candidatus Moranbacteria bacterium GW2011_GWC2_40_12]KKT34046.1 MAG: hypothetical protein UW19_C0002G0019 [Candidatus Moranbacteria bacterium GW2011_GWF2_44_10]KKU00128.1 MAG: hypothetical protein UX02_C0002G0371 [Candidatus Moranbacteria bacterium GW2011_GWC1_45_18]
MKKLWSNEKIRIIFFYALLTVILTWPFAWNFFSSVPSLGSDTMQVIGVAGERMNVLKDLGVFKGSVELMKRSEFNIVTLYAFFQLIFGRIAGYNLLFFASFVLSGFGMYLLAYYFTKSKPASLIAGIIFAFLPFHVHNSLSTNVGTMHQEWLPFFALYLFRFFDNLKAKNFLLAGLFLGLIAFTEHQLFAFTLIFVSFFVVFKIFTQPRIFLKRKFWLYAVVSFVVLSAVSLFMFRSLFEIAFSGNNYLDPGFKAAVKYSNDALSVFVPPNFHSFWPGAFSGLRETFERRTDSSFSAYVGFLVLLLSAAAFFRDRVSKKWFWLAVAIGFYVLSLGPHLHFKGELDPPVKMPYLLAYEYLPFFNNIRTVGRLFVFSAVAFSVLAAWGSAYVILKIRNKREEIKNELLNGDISKSEQVDIFGSNRGQKILFFAVSAVIILEFLAIPVKTNSLLHSSFYEKLGQEKEDYNILEVPGSTDYDFASRDLVWKSIHRKNTINGYDFARVIDDHYTFQRGTPVIRTLLYDIPEGNEKQNDRDIMKDSYYKISNEILNYYNIRYVVLDKEGLKGNPEKGDADQFYSARAYAQNVLKCKSEFEDDFLFACEVSRDAAPRHMFVAMDYSNKHWVGKDKGKDGIRRWAESGAGVKIVNMSPEPQEGKFNFKVKLYKPIRVIALLNGAPVFDKYITQFSEKTYVSVDISGIKSGENEIIFEVRAANGLEIRSEKKSDVATIYDVEVEAKK